METCWPNRINSSQSRFKSYYVVWKLEKIKRVKDMEVEFKSYYVVWKLFRAWELRPRSLCLNRTMQYGNQNSQIDEAFKIAGLNRTMQYGNFPPLKAVLTYCPEFKSYYVVWKLRYASREFPIFLRLNRTMQYGNQNENDENDIGRSSLNRTMQYGNFFFQASTYSQLRV